MNLVPEARLIWIIPLADACVRGKTNYYFCDLILCQSATYHIDLAQVLPSFRTSMPCLSAARRDSGLSNTVAHRMFQHQHIPVIRALPLSRRHAVHGFGLPTRLRYTCALGTGYNEGCQHSLELKWLPSPRCLAFLEVGTQL